jgi:hypothetical protein
MSDNQASIPAAGAPDGGASSAPATRTSSPSPQPAAKASPRASTSSTALASRAGTKNQIHPEKRRDGKRASASDLAFLIPRPRRRSPTPPRRQARALLARAGAICSHAAAPRFFPTSQLWNTRAHKCRRSWTGRRSGGVADGWRGPTRAVRGGRRRSVDSANGLARPLALATRVESVRAASSWAKRASGARRGGVGHPVHGFIHGIAGAGGRGSGARSRWCGAPFASMAGNP